jgi:DNA-binding transcriptional LysR family regulator
MDRLDMMRAFREVARHEAFSPAARQMGMSASALSRHVAGLEDWLGVQLFRRTTRHVRLTDEGQGYLARCVDILESIRDLEQASADAQEGLSGTIRLSSPVYYGRRYIVPLVQEFMRVHPGVQVELMLHDRQVDIVGEGFDLAIRIADLKDSSLIARRLEGTSLMYVASPGYLEQKGLPKSPEDLANHECVIDTVPGNVGRWPFDTEKGRILQRVEGRILVNDGEVACSYAVAGYGIAMLPHFFVEDALAAGKLVRVLEHSFQEEVNIYAVYPSSRFLAPSLRSLVDAIVTGIKSA